MTRPRTTIPHRLVPMLLLACALLAPTAAGETPTGSIAVEFGGKAALSPLPDTFTASDDMGGVSVDYVFRPEVDGRGRIKGDVQLTFEGRLRVGSVAGTVTVPLKGRIKGATGDGSTPRSEVKLLVKAKSDFFIDGAPAKFKLRTKVTGSILHSETEHTLVGSTYFRTVDRYWQKNPDYSFQLVTAPSDAEWALQLDLEPNAKRFGGTAVPVFRGEGLGEHAVRGRYSEKRGDSALRLVPPRELKGARVKLEKFRLLPGGEVSFTARYSVFGHKGVASTEGGDVSAWFAESEGTSDAPLDLTGLLPYEGSVAGGGNSYYVVTGLVPDGMYLLPFEPVGDTELVLTTYRDSTRSDPQCSTGTGRAPECAFTANAEGAAYITARPLSPLGARFSLDLEHVESRFVDEGTSSEPIDITGTLPYDGTVWRHRSYYEVGGLVPGEPYTVTLSEIEHDDVDDTVVLRVFGPGRRFRIWQHDFWRLFSPSLVESVSGVVRADSAGAVVVTVAGSSTESGAGFRISISAGGTPGEGYTEEPIDITNSRPWSGTVNSGGRSYYQVTGLDPQVLYTVSVTEPTAGVALSVYSASSFRDRLCWSEAFGGNAVQCAVSTPTGELHLWVGTSGADGATYVLDVQ